MATTMGKRIFGWVMVVFGIITAIAGAMAYFGGATLSAVLKLLGFGIGMTALGWNMRRRP